MKLRVAGAQVPVDRDIGRNVKALLEAVAQAAEARADILLTPEGSLSGYTHEFDTDAARDGLEAVTSAARSAGVGLALGTCFVESDGRCFNQVRFYEPDGTYLGFHSKILRCGNMADPPEGELNHYATTPLRTFTFSGTTIGGLICNDLWANPGCTPEPDPHLTQQLSRMGARIVFHAINGGRNGSEGSQLAWQYHESNLRMRASAGKLWIVTADNCSPTRIPCSAPSGVINPKGDWACRTADQGKQFFAHTIDLS
jgi:predicted amidohydrolase